MIRSINNDNVKWLGRLALIIVLVGSMDCLVVAFVPHPRPWVAVISFLIPTLNALFVIMPWTKAHAGDEPGAKAP